MEHSFNVQFAQKYGIEEAIIVHNFYFWLRKNIANEKHLHNGRYWTYNSNNAFTKLFPYINKTKIFRVLKHLEECDIILKDNFNTNVWDKTLWYSFSDHGLYELYAFGYDVTDFGKMNHRDNQSETTIPYSKQTDSITDNKEKEDKSSKKKANAMPSNEEHQMFEDFRKAYQGKKRGHDTEFNFFIAQNKDWREVLPKLSLAVTKENVLREQARSLNKFFPEPKNLQTYLNGKNRAWEVFLDDSDNDLFTNNNDNGETTKNDTLIIDGVCYK